MKSSIKFLPTDLSSFKIMREGNYLYVDKTQHIYDLISGGSRCFFLSRPRRFGKSLLISTLNELFSGNKELFKGLDLYKKMKQWPVHPVLHIDLSLLQRDTPAELKQALSDLLKKLGKKHKIDLSEDKTISGKFRTLVTELSEKNKVVLLIDEYDKPILDHVDNPVVADEMRKILSGFYGVIKGLDSSLAFVFITGVSKFTKTSIFSGLNNLNDITLDPRYATLVGYTQQELEHNFKDYLVDFAKIQKMSKQKTLEELKRWYNGYCFTPHATTVYNPYSITSAFDKKHFGNFWFASGSPSFLMKLIKKYDFPLLELDHSLISEYELNPSDVEQLRLEAILVQAGYLTIESYNPMSKNYMLTYPNYEVTESFIKNVATLMTHKKISQFNDLAQQLRQYLLNNDPEGLLTMIYTFLAGVPYSVRIGVERFYQSILYTIFKIIGADVIVEDATNIGRIDITLQTATHIYLIELKAKASAKKALEQIMTRRYFEKFKNDKKQVVLIGLSLNQKKNNLSKQWIIKTAKP